MASTGIADGAAERSTSDRSAAIYAAVIRQLVTKDHTFGDADPGFRVIYVLDGAVENAADPEKPAVRGGEPFSDAVKAKVRANLTHLPPLEFVRERDSVITGKKAGSSPGRVRNRGVLISLGPILGDGTRVEVENNLWMNGLAGQWLTYVLEAPDGKWEITGTTGPMAIS